MLCWSWIPKYELEGWRDQLCNALLTTRLHPTNHKG